jgi:acetylglutamate kinase
VSRLLVKLGGAQLEEPAARATVARSLAAARAAGHELVIVHGGGNQIRALGKQLGIADRYHEGLRITDAATAEVVLMVLAGLVNKALVADLGAAGVPSLGVSGADGALFSARKLESAADLGYVGEVDAVDPRAALALLAARYTPVIATVAPLSKDAAGASDRFYNINADMAVGPLARALDCDAVLFLTDVPGVLDAAKQRLARLTSAECAALRASGVVSGGMIPKVLSALAALDAHPRALVKIAPAAGANAVLDALTDAVGTRFCAAANAGALA